MKTPKNRNFTRAQRKKARRSFHVGDVVTWGDGSWSHRVLEVQAFGVIVDATSAGFGRYFVAYDSNTRNGVYHHEGGQCVRHSTDEPDVLLRRLA